MMIDVNIDSWLQIYIKTDVYTVDMHLAYMKKWFSNDWVTDDDTDVIGVHVYIYMCVILIHIIIEYIIKLR